MEKLIFVGIEHRSGNTSTFIGIDISEKIPSFGARSLDDIAKRIADEFKENFEEHVTLQVPENVSGPYYELTSSDKILLKILIEKCLAKKKYPGYRRLKVEEVIDNGSGGIQISFIDFGIVFSLPLKDVTKHGLENLSPGDIIYTKSKKGIEAADFLGGGLIEDIIIA